MTHLRAATEADVPAILAMIGELARYERLAHEVVATEEALRRTLFGPHRYAEVVMAEVDGAIAGQALFFHNYSTFHARPGIYLEDLFVRPSFRGQGVGKSLLVELARIAVDRGCARFEWAVLDWNAPAIEFYHRLGGVPMEEWTVFRVSGDALAQLAAHGTSTPG